MDFPPEPWHLRGQMYVSLWSLPRRELPPLPPGLAGMVRPVVVGGRGVVGTAWVRYEPGGVLHYRELLAAVLVRAGLRPRISIVQIWVDSETSRVGGRELWGIPKELAELAIEPDDNGGISGSAATPTGPIARARVTPGPGLPGRWPVAFTVAQLLAARLRTTPVRCRARIGGASSTWQVEPGGPLGYLAGRRPLLTLAVRDFRLVFGSADPHHG
ncbi:acetoacetate decarboxylase family protein [Plantactinospora sonchi]|uniref:Acetoacetate decarboxylase family protein n=1 Tax=Plantactinospora sonchi TaxID=1544735 RepID=A0ABU7RQI2_9ACTN